MSITVEEIHDKDQWNNFLISQQPRGHLLQAYEWGDLKPILGGGYYRLGALEDGRLIGTMMLYENYVPIPIPGLRNRLKYLYCSRGPTVGSPDSPALLALLEHAHQLAGKTHAILLRLEPNITDDDPDMDRWIAVYHKLGFRSNPNPVHLPRCWVLDIRPPMKDLFAHFKTTWRQNIRVAERKGVIVREVKTEADLQAYYEIYKETSERDDFFIHTLDYHKAILNAFGSQGEAVLYIAEHEGDILAARLIICMGKWCWDMFGASSNHKRNLKATYLLQYRCLEWAKEHGCDYFDFRVIPTILEPGQDMWGVYEFKHGFGGFSRMNMPTQDYVYRPLLNAAWNKVVDMRRDMHQRERHKVEVERAARGKQAPQHGESESVPTKESERVPSQSTHDKTQQQAKEPSQKA
jgi:lipid II:glycine glycyltransferase (peptidoglycan interpeptide bridge formation enzyme)